MDRPRRAAPRGPVEPAPEGAAPEGARPRWRGRIALVGALVAVVAGLVIAGAVSGGGGSGAGQPERRAAPTLPRQVLNPPAVTLADLRGKPAVVNFWASWCTPCRKEAPELERFAHSLHGRARLVGVDWGDDAGNARAFIRRSGWTFPVLRDADNAVGGRFGIAGLPTTFVLDARGRIVTKLQGPQTVATLDAALRDAA